MFSDRSIGTWAPMGGRWGLLCTQFRPATSDSCGDFVRAPLSRRGASWQTQSWRWTDLALPTHILLVYGYLLLFAWVLIEQVGVPLPATPILLAAGALSADRELSFVTALVAGVGACLVSDSTWFFIGRRYGRQVLNVLCKLSLEPTTCVRKTQISFGRRRHGTLLFGKFVPGLASLTSPIAGQSGMPYAEYIFLDLLGAIIWVGAVSYTHLTLPTTERV